MTRPHPSGDRQSPSPSLRAGSPRVSPGAFFFRHAAMPNAALTGRVVPDSER